VTTATLLPGLVLVGAPRSGTTTLATALATHPEVAFSLRKEVEYFDLYYDRGPDWYAAQFPVGPGMRVEATPTYLSDSEALTRIARDLPHTRFVAVLREPVSRAWSQYWFFTQLGIEPRSWRRALRDEARLGYEDPVGYLWRGRYAEQVARWDAEVGPDRLLVLLFDDLVARPAEALRQVCAFGGLTEGLAEVPTRSVNPSARPWSRRLTHLLASPDAGRLRRRALLLSSARRQQPQLPHAERQALACEFSVDKALLEDRLGRALPATWWPER